MILENVKVEWNRSLGAAYRHMGIRTAATFSTAVPGQFVMVKVGDGLSPLLPRPFSIHRLIERGGEVTGIELLYKMIGPTTDKMGRLAAGDTIRVLGPLGRGFSLPRGSGAVALTGGGIGIAPLVFLASYLMKNGIGPERIKIFLGGRLLEDLLCAGEFKQMGLQVYTTTEDGSAGEKGLITRPLERSVKSRAVDLIYACGPMGMLQGVSALAAENKVACQVSIETIMACGMGACMGCAVKSKADPDGKCRRACLDGPVFEAAQISLEH